MTDAGNKTKFCVQTTQASCRRGRCQSALVGASCGGIGLMSTPFFGLALYLHIFLLFRLRKQLGTAAHSQLEATHSATGGRVCEGLRCPRRNTRDEFSLPLVHAVCPAKICLHSGAVRKLLGGYSVSPSLSVRGKRESRNGSPPYSTCVVTRIQIRAPATTPVSCND